MSIMPRLNCFSVQHVVLLFFDCEKPRVGAFFFGKNKHLGLSYISTKLTLTYAHEEE